MSQPTDFKKLDIEAIATEFAGYLYQPGDVVDLAPWDRYQRRDHDESIAPYDAWGICRVVSCRRACCTSGVMVTVVNERRREIELDQGWMRLAVEF